MNLKQRTALLFIFLFLLLPQTIMLPISAQDIRGISNQSIDFDRMAKLDKKPPNHLIQRLGNYQWATNTNFHPLLMHPNGKHAFSAGGMFIQKLDLSDGRVLISYPVSYTHLAPQISSNGKFLISASKTQVTQINLENNKIETRRLQSAGILSFSLSPDGGKIVLQTIDQEGRKLKIMDIASLKSIHKSQSIPELNTMIPQAGLTWTKDHQRILFTGTATPETQFQSPIYQYEIETKKLSRLEGFRINEALIKQQGGEANQTRRIITGLYLNADESRLITLDTLGLAISWNFDTGQQEGVLLQAKALLSKHSQRVMNDQISVSLQSLADPPAEAQKLPPLPKAGEILDITDSTTTAIAVISLDSSDKKQPVQRLVASELAFSSWSLDKQTLYSFDYQSTRVQLRRFDAASAPSPIEALLTSISMANENLITLGKYGQLILWTAKGDAFTRESQLDLPIKKVKRSKIRLQLSADQKHLLISDSNSGLHLVDVTTMRYIDFRNDKNLAGQAAIMPSTVKPSAFQLLWANHKIPVLVENDKLKIGEKIEFENRTPSNKMITLTDQNQALVALKADLLLIDLKTGKTINQAPLFKSIQNPSFTGSILRQIHLMPDTSWIILFFDNGLRIVDYTTGQVLVDRNLRLNKMMPTDPSRRQFHQAAIPLNQSHYLLASPRGHWEIYRITAEQPDQSAFGHAAGFLHFNLLSNERFLTISHDGTAALWKLKTQESDTKLTNDQFKKLWADLSSPAKLLQAQLYLRSMSQHHLSLIKQLVEPVSLDEKQAQQWITQLSSTDREEQAKAKTALVDIGPMVSDLLREAAENAETLEFRELCLEIVTLLDNNQNLSPKSYLTLTLIQALETLPESEANEIILKLSKGHPKSPITQAAIKALKRP